MLTLKFSNAKANLVQFVIGGQSELQMDLTGFMFVNMGKIQKDFEDPALPLYVVITRCEDEEVTLQTLFASTDESGISKNGVITCTDSHMEMLKLVGDNIEKDIENKLNELRASGAMNEPAIPESYEQKPSSKKQEKASTPDGSKSVKIAPKNENTSAPKCLTDLKINYLNGDPRGVFVTNALCPLCQSEGVYLRKGMPAVCADCLKIEYGLGKFKPNKEGMTNKEKKELTDYLKSEMKKPTNNQDLKDTDEATQPS